MRFVCVVVSVYIPGSGGVRVYMGTGVHACGCNSLLPASLRSNKEERLPMLRGQLGLHSV